MTDCPICGAMMVPETCPQCDGCRSWHNARPTSRCTCGDSKGAGRCPEIIKCFECNGDGEYLVCSALPHSAEQMAAWRARKDAELVR